MRFLVLVKASKESEAGVLPSEEMLARMGAFNEELLRAGVLLAAEGVHPSSTGARLRWSGGRATATDGPFFNTDELVAGFWLIQVTSKDEALALISRAPFEDGANEIRRIFEAEDFGAAFTPELREQEERHRAQISAEHESLLRVGLSIACKKAVTIGHPYARKRLRVENAIGLHDPVLRKNVCR